MLTYDAQLYDKPRRGKALLYGERPAAGAVKSQASVTPDAIFVVYRLNFSWGEKTYPVIFELSLAANQVYLLSLKAFSACCSNLLARPSSWFEADKLVCADCGKLYSYDEKKSYEVTIFREGPDTQVRLEQASKFLRHYYELENFDPLLETLFVSTLLNSMTAAAQELNKSLPGEEMLLAGLKKRYLLYPGETKKLKLETLITKRLQAVLGP